MQVWVEVLVVPGTYHAQIAWRNVIRLCHLVGFQRDQIFHVIAVYFQPLAVAGVERIHMIPDRAVAGSLDVCLCRQHLFFCTVLVEDGALPVDIGNVVACMTRIGEIAGVEYRLDLHFFHLFPLRQTGFVPIRHSYFRTLLRLIFDTYLQRKRAQTPVFFVERSVILLRCPPVGIPGRSS